MGEITTRLRGRAPRSSIGVNNKGFCVDTGSTVPGSSGPIMRPDYAETAHKPQLIRRRLCHAPDGVIHSRAAWNGGGKGQSIER